MISKRAKRTGFKELEIFDYFQVDELLPKYSKKNGDDKNKNKIVLEGNSVYIDTPSTSDFDDGEWDEDSISVKRKKGKKSLLNKICLFFKKTKEKSEKKKHLIAIRDFFLNIADNFKEFSNLGEIADYYEKALLRTKDSGQYAMLEQIKQKIDIVRYEVKLKALKLNKYLTEEQIYDFYESVGEKKALKLTWIKNFMRILPDNLIKVKKKLDSYNIFDNYVILHYDPKHKGEKLTEEEKEIKKDPILFGLIKGSRRLYFIGDWKDEYCDLTLEELLTTIGEKAFTINNKTIKTYIDTIE